MVLITTYNNIVKKEEWWVWWVWWVGLRKKRGELKKKKRRVKKKFAGYRPMPHRPTTHHNPPSHLHAPHEQPTTATHHPHILWRGTTHHTLQIYNITFICVLYYMSNYAPKFFVLLFIGGGRSSFRKSASRLGSVASPRGWLRAIPIMGVSA